MTDAKHSRRRFVRYAVAGGALLALGGAISWVRTRGYGARGLTVLSAWQVEVVEHAARRILKDDGRAAPTPDDIGVAAYVDGYVAGMAEPTKTDFLRLLAYLEHLAPAAVGKASRFTLLPAIDQDRTLAAMEASSRDLLRAGFAGLKAVLVMGYYRDPRTWPILRYEGPWVSR